MSSQISFSAAQELPNSSPIPAPNLSRSSPSSLAPYSSAHPTTRRKNTYRPAKPLSHALLDTTSNYLDDGLYLEALGLLCSLLSSGTSIKASEHRLPAFIPSTQQLGLLSTIVVHPSFTTRATSADRLQASNNALRLLHGINKLVGPVNANFSAAFAFQSARALRDSARRRVGDTDSTDGEDEARTLRSDLANAGSVFSQAEDFWQVVGWAFNCSIEWQKRWERWQLWLDFMLRAMEDDWAERQRMYEEENSQKSSPAEQCLLESMIVRYLPLADGRTGRRRIMRAILANGSTRALNEFKEVFRNELLERKPETDTVPHQPSKLNIDEGDFGDYGMDDEDEVMGNIDATSPRRSTRATTSRRVSIPSLDGTSDESDTGETTFLDKDIASKLGGIEAVLLRQRLLALLWKVTIALQTHFTHEWDLFDLFTEFMRPLPLSSFSILLSTSHLDFAAQAHLIADLLIPLLSPHPPVYDGITITQADLVKHFLPFSANTNSTADNAKVSLLLETLMMGFFTNVGLQPTEEFGAAVEEGIRRREEKAIGDARKKGKGQEGEEGEARIVLKMSGERMMALLEIVESG